MTQVANTQTVTAKSISNIAAYGYNRKAIVLTTFLNHIRDTQTPIKTFIVNGIGLDGVLKSFGADGIFCQRNNEKMFSRMGAISAISPAHSSDYKVLPADKIKEMQEAIKADPDHTSSLGQYFLEALSKKKITIKGHLLNSHRVSCKVIAYDDFVILVEDERGCHQICFWQSFSTILPGESEEQFSNNNSFNADELSHNNFS